MHFIKDFKKRKADQLADDDPISGVAQLFDVSIAFIVAVIAALFTLLSSQQLLSEDSEWTITRKDKQGNIEMIEKKDNRIIKKKVTDAKATGNGVRLGTAYELEDGQVIYVPDDATQK